MAMPYLVDQNISSALCLYFLYAIRPGSYTECLLLGDYESALTRAHPHIKDASFGNGKQSPHDFTVKFVEGMPDRMRGEGYHTWVGYQNLEGSDLSEFHEALAKQESFLSIVNSEEDHSTVEYLKQWIQYGKRNNKR